MGNTVHEHFTERVELARIYAEDGAFLSAARILSGLAADLRSHAAQCDAALAAMRRPKRGQP